MSDPGKTFSDQPKVEVHGDSVASGIDPDLAAWNDRMYAAHPTPFEGGLAARIQRARVRRMWQLAELRPSESAFEIGCEAGRLLVEAPKCARLVGADISPAALEDARALFEARRRSVELHQLDAQNPFPFPPGTFQVLVCADMLEHVHEPRRVLENIHALADDDTRIVVSVPIEAPKLMIKTWLDRLGVFDLLFSGIEREQSEWHLHAFSGAMLRREIRGLFRVVRSANVWGAHHIALLAKEADGTAA